MFKGKYFGRLFRRRVRSPRSGAKLASVKRVKVLFVSAWPPALGGVAAFAERLTKDTRFQNRVELIRHDNLARPSPWLSQDSNIAWMPFAPLLRGFSSLEKLVRFAFLVFGRRPAIVQIHYNGPFTGIRFCQFLLYLLLARIGGARTIARHGGKYQLHTTKCSSAGRVLVRRGYLSWLNGVILQWPELRDAYVAFADKMGVRLRAIVVPNTVDTTYYTPLSQGVDRESTNATPIVGFIAGPDPMRKGVFTILKMLRELKGDSIPPFVVTAIGIHPDVSRKIQRKAVGIHEIHFMGYLSGVEKRKWFQALDIFLLPSFREGFPNVLLEAMSTETAVITTPVDAIPSVVEHERSGLFVEPGNASELASALCRLLVDSDLRHSLAREARQTVRNHFEVSGDWIEHIMKLYEPEA